MNRSVLILQASPNLFAKGGAGAGYQYAARHRREYCCARHVTDFIPRRLEGVPEPAAVEAARRGP